MLKRNQHTQKERLRDMIGGVLLVLALPHELRVERRIARIQHLLRANLPVHRGPLPNGNQLVADAMKLMSGAVTGS